MYVIVTNYTNNETNIILQINYSFKNMKEILHVLPRDEMPALPRPRLTVLETVLG